MTLPLQGGAALIPSAITILILAGCANCDSCRQMPGWDGRYATHDKGALNREMTRSKQEKAPDEQD